MIKRANVTAMYQINLYCDKCGTRMERGGIVLTSNPPQFPYKCPECGHETTSHIAYPVQQVEFDEENAEVIPEPNIPPIEMPQAGRLEEL